MRVLAHSDRTPPEKITFLLAASSRSLGPENKCQKQRAELTKHQRTQRTSELSDQASSRPDYIRLHRNNNNVARQVTSRPDEVGRPLPTVPDSSGV